MKFYQMTRAVLCCAAALVFAGGCAPKNEPVARGASGPDAQAANPNEKRYPLTGVILAVDREHRTLRVKHDEIPGFMPAMTMEFSVSVGDAANAKVGQRIRAELVTSEGGDFRLEKIWPDDEASRATMDAASRALAQDTAIRGRAAYREVGELAPAFALLDQDGRVVEAARFRGRQVMLNFIFTRCPVATMCPLAVAKFQQTQRLAAEVGVADLELVSISLDPAYDTPGVLKEYAIQRAIDTGNYSFLTGPDAAIKSLLAQFGVLTKLEGELLNHTLATLLIDENGRIIWRADGSQWEPREFVEKMRKPDEAATATRGMAGRRQSAQGGGV
ncbi:SCO family protein [Termitidicoccus mucosus]|uniref:Thioredoxin domain-containing protein n=1 Tax=Termitidicoccus mucosus TaxID=1184151 RepID=A0A178IDH6_9BACT|nr:hypothetical protein AW736_21785 [Opitutaceae bacterium TSB47]